jgi:hypothetical protein
MEVSEKQSVITAGVVTTACMEEEDSSNTGSPVVRSQETKPDTCEG